MQCVTTLFLFFLLQAGHGSPIADFYEDVSVIPKVNIFCLVEHCIEESEGCALSEECRQSFVCVTKCLEKWDEDTTPEKYHVQNCTNICAFSYDVKPYRDFMSCMSGHMCMEMPPIPSRCRAPSNLTVLKNVTVKDLTGAWWVVKGYHPVYDCYPCQSLHFKQINSTTWDYLPKYQVYLANGTLQLVSQSFPWNVSDPSSGPELSFVYYDIGLVHSETWWLFDAADDFSYVLLYYCGATLQWHYDGALVFAREKSLSATSYAHIATAYSKAIGLDASKFCNTTTTNCPD